MNTAIKYLCVSVVSLTSLAAPLFGAPPSAATDAAPPAVVLPLDRTAYFVGEKVLLTVTDEKPVTVELTAGNQRWPVYKGVPGALVLDTALLAPGEYGFAVNGAPTVQKIYIAPIARSSAAALADEAHPRPPQASGAELKDPALRAATLAKYSTKLDAQLRETGMVAAFQMMGANATRNFALDAMARTGVLSFNNPETRPTSFLPVANDLAERDGLSQRMLLTAQANGRYPNFGGFCVAYDCGGFQPGNRRMLLVYWKWNDQTENLRGYLASYDKILTDGFKRETGYDWVKPEEYIAYTLAIKRPDMAPVIDLPTQRWLDQMAPTMPPLNPTERVAFEKRLDAWSAWLMSQYPSTYADYMQNLRGFDPSLRHTGSVQIDHAAIIQGQYLPPAYRPLDFRYQSTWNDQFGAPDYIYQALFTAGMLDTERPDGQPVWVSNAHGLAHGLSPVLGKFTRVAAQILPHGGSGVGNAFEAFSTMLGGMQETVSGKGPLLDVQSGHEFTERFAGLALTGRGDYGVGILLSKAQFSRQYVCLAFGTPQFRAFVSLTKMGYTPVFLTDDEIAAKQYRGVKSLVVFGQTVPLPAPVLGGLQAFAAAGGGEIIRDGNTSAEVAATKTIPLTLPLRNDPGRPHNWSASIKKATFLFAEQHQELAPPLEAVLAGRGHAWLRAAGGPTTDLTLQQIDGGGEAKYVVAINDTFVKTQADWRELKEEVIPSVLPLRAGEEVGVRGWWLYDLTEEKSLGELKPFTCDLTKTTARLYGIFPHAVSAPEVKCRQSIATGVPLPIRVGFNVTAVVPFYLSVLQPDGKPFFGGYRVTQRDGTFTIELRVPSNAPAGEWKVQARSQLDGQITTVPVTVKAGKVQPFAAPLQDPLVVREKSVIDQLLRRGATIDLPLFPEQAELSNVAATIRTKLAAQGVTVNILNPPVMANYFRAYVLSNDMAAANAVVTSGQAIGRVQGQTLHGNDWFGDSFYRTGKPVILLDVAGVKDNPMAESFLDGGTLWPTPTPGLAVVQGIAWAFGPRQSAIVISATDEAGLQAAADRLTKLPEDFLTTSVREARAGLFQELHIGSVPAEPSVKGLTAQGATTTTNPDPFVMNLGSTKPYPANQPPIPPEENERVVGVPSLPGHEDFTAKVQSSKGYLSAFVYGMEFDLRFNDALALTLNVTNAGPVTISADGIFRYIDRAPCSAPQWEDILAIRAKYFKPARQPISFDVLLDGKLVGKLDKTTTAEKEVQMELYTPSGGKPKSQTEEVVTSVAGTVPLPAGKHTLLLVHHNIVDGQIQRLRVGLTPAQADAMEAERQAAAEKQRKADELNRQQEEQKAKAAGK